MAQLLFSYLFRTSLAAFRTAILNDDTEKICRILDVERDHLHKDIDTAGNTGLLLAIQYSSLVTVRLLLSLGAHPDQSNVLTFQTPLTLLASVKYKDAYSHGAQIAYEMAQALLDAGAYVDKPSPHTYIDVDKNPYTGKETPLMTAVRKQNLPMATLFVEKKANVNYMERTSQIRPIHMAISNGDEVMFDLLENAGASFRSVVTVGDNTLLHWFCYRTENDTHLSLLEKLLNKGCDVDAENCHQHTPLMLAARHGLPNTCRMLLQAKGRTDKVDYKGFRAVDLAEPGSECSLLLRRATEAQLNLNRAKRTTSSDTVIWRKRLGQSRQTTEQSTDISDVESNGVDNRRISSNFSDEEKTPRDQLSYPVRSYVYPIARSESEEMSTKRYERMWEKLLQSKQQRSRSQSRTAQRTLSNRADYI